MLLPNSVRMANEILQTFAGRHQPSQVCDANHIVRENFLKDLVWQRTVIHFVCKNNSFDYLGSLQLKY